MQLTVTVTKFNNSNVDALERKWLDLEDNADNSIFISWLWIKNWLTIACENSSDDLLVIEAHEKNKTKGLGIVCQQKRKVFGLIPLKQWWLHKTGQQAQDQIWIEFNDFLVEKSDADHIRRVMINYIYEQHPDIAEIFIGLSNNQVQSCFTQTFPYQRTTISSDGFYIDYSTISTDFLTDALSKNTRYQINRSKKLLKQFGNLTFTVVTDTNEINTLLPEIRSLHINRWHNSPEGSGFNNEKFEKFHHAMINDDKNSQIQIAVLSLDNQAIGYLYNFVYQGTVSFYLSALSDKFSEKIKIGMLLHAETINYYREKDMKFYDLLAGDARYKRSLSTSHYQLTLKSFYRNNRILKLEHLLRLIKAQLSSRIKACYRQ